MTQAIETPVPAAPAAPVKTIDVKYRVLRTDGTVTIHVETSDRWRALCVRNAYTTNHHTAADGRIVAVSLPRDMHAAHATDLLRGAVFATGLGDSGAEPIVGPLTFKYDRPVSRTDIETAVNTVREYVARTVDAFLRPLDLSVIVSTTIGGVVSQ